MSAKERNLLQFNHKISAEFDISIRKREQSLVELSEDFGARWAKN